MWPTRATAIGGLIAILGFSIAMATLASATATRWDVDPLQYESVDFNRGFRGPPSIHIRSIDGRTYLLPQRLWGESYEGLALVELLQKDSVAAVRVAGGESRLLHGFPTVERLETSGLTLESPPRHPARLPLMAGLGALLLLLGSAVAYRGRRG